MSINHGTALAGVAPGKRSHGLIVRAQGSALDQLREENELLKRTIAGSRVSISNLENALGPDAAEVPDRNMCVGKAFGDNTLVPEDFWSPAIEVPDNVAFHDEIGAISRIPDHDGTACFKWDETLWAKADHFKVRGHGGPGDGTPLARGTAAQHAPLRHHGRPVAHPILRQRGSGCSAHSSMPALPWAACRAAVHPKRACARWCVISCALHQCGRQHS